MTARDREMLKALVDRRRRELLADESAPICVGCGADYDACTSGCHACLDRRRNRKRRPREAQAA